MSEEADYKLPEGIEEEDVVVVSTQDAAGIEEVERLRGSGFQVIHLGGLEPEGFAVLRLQPSTNLGQNSENKTRDMTKIPSWMTELYPWLTYDIMWGDLWQEPKMRLCANVETNCIFCYKGGRSWDPRKFGCQGNQPRWMRFSEWNLPTKKDFHLEQKPPIQLPQQISSDKEELTIEARFSTICSRCQYRGESRKVCMQLELLHFGVTKTDSHRRTPSTKGGVNEVRFVHKVEIQVKPAAETRWIDLCLAVEALPDDTQPEDLDLVKTTTSEVDISPGDVRSLLKLIIGSSNSTAVKVTGHKWFSETNWQDKSVVWRWMLLYLRDGRSLYARRSLRSGDKLHLQNLLPFFPESFQMSGRNLGVEAIWSLDDALDASELAFDINVTLYTSVIRQIPFWSCCCVWRAPTFDLHEENVNWHIVAPLSFKDDNEDA